MNLESISTEPFLSSCSPTTSITYVFPARWQITVSYHVIYQAFSSQVPTTYMILVSSCLIDASAKEREAVAQSIDERELDRNDSFLNDANHFEIGVWGRSGRHSCSRYASLLYLHEIEYLAMGAR